MDRYVIVKIGRPTEEEFEEWKRKEGMERLDRGQVQSGNQFVGEITVHVAANSYTLEIVTRILRTACINYSLHTGREVRKRSKKCTPSTASNLTFVELMSELQGTQIGASDNTTQEQSNPHEDVTGKPGGD